MIEKLSQSCLSSHKIHYNFSPTHRIELNRCQLPANCLKGQTHYKNNFLVIEPSIQIGEWLFCIESSEGATRIGGFLRMTHYTFDQIDALKKGQRWSHILLHWLYQTILPITHPSFTLGPLDHIVFSREYAK